MAQVTLPSLRYRPVPVIPIIAARKLSPLLDEASRIDLGFPHDFYAKELVRTFAYGGTRDKILV